MRVMLDDEGFIEEPCLSCGKAYIEDIWDEWCCDEKECPYEKEKAVKVWHESFGFNEVECSSKLQEAISTAFKALEQKPCEDCVSRQAVLDTIQKLNIPEDMCVFEIKSHIEVKIATLPPVTPQPKIGHWLRMSDLSEKEDDRYKCSRCGNVVHHTNKMNLYTFNSWCGRCGSDNSRK